MKTTERFSNRVENYVKYRPGYPPEILPLLRDQMNLRADSIVADIGAGTGISARLFLENGNRVFGVEPNRAMRDAAEIFLKDFPLFESVDGTAENTNLETGSVDSVVAAQALSLVRSNGRASGVQKNFEARRLRGFDMERTPTGGDRVFERLRSLLIEFGTDYEQIRHDNITKEKLRDFFRIDFQSAVFQNRQSVDFDGLKGRLLSSSYIPSEDDPRFSRMIKNLASLFATHAENGKIDILYDTKIFYGQL